MRAVTITIDGQPVTAQPAATILQAARSAGVYIPTLCHHPDLPPAQGKRPAPAVHQGAARLDNALDRELDGCGLCLVEVAGRAEPVPACAAPAAAGMRVTTLSPALTALRRQKLLPILARHPHACLACAQAEGCPRTQCSAGVAPNERCCPRFDDCELRRLAAYLGLPPQAPRWVPTSLPLVEDDPLFIRDYNLCIGCTRCVRACHDLRGVGALGFVFDAQGRVQAGALAPSLAASACRFCTACVEVCPTGALRDKRPAAGDRDAALVPCRQACPAGMDAPEYLRLIAAGQPDQALAVIREAAPLPGVLGRVCPRPCERQCRRGQVNEPVSICLLKRFAADQGGEQWKRGLAKPLATGKRAGVVGAGPAGLTAAFFLARKGHAVTVLEAEPEPGGMLRYGLPAFRLPPEVLAAEIADIAALGVEIVTKARVESLAGLQAMGFDAVFLAVGAQAPRRLDIPGGDQARLLQGLDFLKAVRRGENPRVGSRVVVVGGGNVAVDAALTALRQGADSVDLVCLERRGDMPAHPWEVEAAEAEGVRVRDAWGPVRLDGRGLVCRRCIAVLDQQGRFNPQYDESQTACFPANQVIAAIGQAGDLAFIEPGSRVGVDRGLIAVDPRTMATGQPGVFAGGDAASPPGSVVEAVAAGRRAAAAMDAYLGGDGVIDAPLTEHAPPSPRLGRVEGFAGLKRLAPPQRQAGERKADHGEIGLGYNGEEARGEAARCLQCQTRLMISPAPRPPRPSLALSRENLDAAPEAEGVVILLDEGGNTLAIKGVMNIRQELVARLEGGSRAASFEFHQDPMYSRAESERLQAHLQRHGAMPPGDRSAGGDDLDDLF